MPESTAFFIASETNLMTTLITDRSTLKANTDADFERMAERGGASVVMAHMPEGPVDRSEARRYFDSPRRDWKVSQDRCWDVVPQGRPHLGF